MFQNLSATTKNRIVLILAGLFINFLVLAFYVYQPYIIRQADRQIYDIYLRANAGGEPSPTPAIIDIDEPSLNAYGQWPWPRHLIADLIRKLYENGAASIGLDIIFAEPDRTSPVVIQETLNESFGVDIGFTGLPQSLADNDMLLANIIYQTPTILGFYVNFDNPTENEANFSATLNSIPEDLPHYDGILERIPANALEPKTFMTTGKGVSLPLSILYQVAPVASLNVAPDPDGIVRAIPLVIQVEDRVFASLGLRSLMRGLGVNTFALEGGPYGLAAIHVGKYRIPVSPSGLFYLPFRGGRGVYPYFSAKDVLDGTLGPEELAGRVLLIGTSAPGLLDIRATPFDPIYPGVESHATVVDAILTGRSISLPLWSPLVQLSAIVAIGIISVLIFGLAPALVYVPSLFILSGASLGSTWHLFSTQGIFISPLYTLFTVGAIMIALLAVRFWQESKQKRQLRKAFSRYVSPEMVKQISESGEVVLTGEEREVTLMFTDLRGFTTLSEKLEPQNVVGVLNRYFTPMTSLIQETQGTVDKFIGDAIMAFWNAPLDVENHQLNAVLTSLNMQKALLKLNVELEAEFGISLRMGAGLHTGKVYVGNMGSEELLDYTCIGDTVNLTSRLESLCSTYGVKTVISLTTAQSCLEISQNNPNTTQTAMFTTSKIEPAPDLVFLPIDFIRVKGKTEPVEICFPYEKEEYINQFEELKRFYEARHEYNIGDFKNAEIHFKSLAEDFPQIVYYQTFYERSQILAQEPPEEWEGVWTFTKK